MDDEEEFSEMLQIASQDPWNYQFTAKLFTDMFLRRTHDLFMRRVSADFYRTYVAIVPSQTISGAHAMTVIVPFWETTPSEILIAAVKVYLAQRAAVAVATADVESGQLRVIIEVQRMPRRAYTAKLEPATAVHTERVAPWEPALVGAGISMLPAPWENVQ